MSENYEDRSLALNYADYLEGHHAVDWHRESAEELRRQHKEIEALKEKVAAHAEWHDKTEWLRKDLQPHELGKHLVDVLRERLDQRHVGYWHTHSVYEPKGEFSPSPLLPADVADGWKQEVVYAKYPFRHRR